jgi:hypothetical protein
VCDKSRANLENTRKKVVVSESRKIRRKTTKKGTIVEHDVTDSQSLTG